MVSNFLSKSLSIFLRRQTNILSAAFVIMATVIFSQFLGLIRQRLLVAIFGASNILGVYLASASLPDLLFQIIIAGSLSSAFIPVFSDFLVKNKEHEAHKMASTLLTFSFIAFFAVSLILFVFATFFLQMMNLGAGFTHAQMVLMSNLMRIVIVGQFLFILGTFFSALLQSYNHFFIPGFAAALYNLGIIIGILTLSPLLGIYAPAIGMTIGGFFFICAQLPLVQKMGFRFRPSLSLKVPGVIHVLKLMWPRTISLAIFQFGSIVTVTLVSFLPSAGRNYVIFDYAQTLVFAPIVLFGQTISQAAFPVLAREREKLSEFKQTFITSFNQLLYLVLPFSVLFLVLRIPIVRIVFGVSQFDWEATVLTGKTLAYFSLSIFAQALTYLVARGFYALHDTKSPLIIGTLTTLCMIGLGILFILHYHLGVESIAFAYSIASILNLLLLFIVLDKKVGGFVKLSFYLSTGKIFLASFCTGFALYIPIKLLDQLVFDTTKTFNLLLLTGISSLAGLSFYLFLTWLLNVEEASTFLLLFRKVGNWRKILGEREEVIDTTHFNP